MGSLLSLFSFFLAFIKRIIIIRIFFNIMVFLFSSAFAFISNINLALAALAA